MTRSDILKDALAARIAEVEGYQINIDNYRLGIEHIDSLDDGDREELAGFRAELEQRLAAERQQQKRAAVMLAVIRQQVEAP